jgi:NADH dehydrogenase (ubiquinone) 1 alpha subcomplex subunit 5
VRGREGSFILDVFVQVLFGLYSKTLSLLQGFPKEAVYRQQTEQVVQQRLQIVQAEDNIAAIEKKIGCGQVEELIDQVGGVVRWKGSLIR